MGRNHPMYFSKLAAKNGTSQLRPTRRRVTIAKSTKGCGSGRLDGHMPLDLSEHPPSRIDIIEVSHEAERADNNSMAAKLMTRGRKAGTQARYAIIGSHMWVAWLGWRIGKTYRLDDDDGSFRAAVGIRLIWVQPKA